MMRDDPLTQKAYQLSLQVIFLVDSLPKRDVVSREVGRQVVRSATSVVANIVEAQGASSKRDFARFFRYSFKSVQETDCWIRMLVDTNRISKDRVVSMILLADEILRMLQASLKTLQPESATDESSLVVDEDEFSEVDAL